VHKVGEVLDLDRFGQKAGMTVQEDRVTIVRNVLVVVPDEGTGAEWYRRVTDTPGMRCCGVATTLADGLDMVHPGEVDAVVVGDVLPDARVWNAVRAFRDLDPKLSVIVLATNPTIETLREARWAGAVGLVSLDTPFEDVAALATGSWSGRLLVDADAALQAFGSEPNLTGRDERTPPRTNNDIPLTPREREVLLLLGRGLDPTHIAGELGLSIHTARGHVKRILAKLGAHSQLEAVIIAVQVGLLPQLGR
jgi:DNA-binding NarL/FixJ family response regulator